MDNVQILDILSKLRTKLNRQKGAVNQTEAEIRMWESQLGVSTPEQTTITKNGK